VAAFATVTLALIGVYIAFALAASWINEQIATFLELRSKTLIAGISKMIGEAASADFFGHPLIVSLGETTAQDSITQLATLFGVRYVNQKAPVPTAPAAAGVPPTSAPEQQRAKRPAYISAEHFATVVLDVVQKKIGIATTPAFGAAVTDIVAGMNGMADPASPYKPLYDVLLPIWRDARGDYDKFAAGIASWYDSQMDRVSGWYKRSAQIMLTYIGLAIAVGFNVDTLQIVRELQRNTALSNSLAAATQAYYQQLQAQPAASPAPSASPGTAAVSPQIALSSITGFTEGCSTTRPCTCDDGFSPAVQGGQSVCRIDQTGLAQLPIGWTGARWEHFSAHLLPKDPKLNIAERLARSELWLKLAGLAITTIAILLGAPFWFDVLGAIINVRSVGVKPATAASTSSNS
jgi:hypothetical protein